MKYTNLSYTQIFFKVIFENILFKSIALIFALLVFLKIITKDMPELFTGGEYVFEVLVQLFSRSLVSVIFYILLVYIPNYKKCQFIHEQYLLFAVGIISNYYLVLLESIDKFKLHEDIFILNIKEHFKCAEDILKEASVKDIFIHHELLSNTYRFVIEEDLSRVSEVDEKLYKELRYIKMKSSKVFSDNDFHGIERLLKGSMDIIDRVDEYRDLLIENIQSHKEVYLDKNSCI